MSASDSAEVHIRNPLITSRRCYRPPVAEKLINISLVLHKIVPGRLQPLNVCYDLLLPCSAHQDKPVSD